MVLVILPTVFKCALEQSICCFNKKRFSMKKHRKPFFYLGFITNPKNGRVKALSKVCLDRTYLDNIY